MRPTIGLVSGTYNRFASLQTMIASFRACIPPGIPYTITIVDGGSTDGTLDWCRTQRDIHLIEHGELKGAIIAFTEGAFSTDAKYILLANDDIVFFPDSILPAIVHLENNKHCGAVAFRDNRPLPPTYTDKDYKVLTFPHTRKGRVEYLPYAQVGLFRKWLGDKVHWWAGEKDEMLLPGLVYGGDNMLSAYIWNYGYSVEAVEGCAVHDNIVYDELRTINQKRGAVNKDSDYYYARWPQGAIVPDQTTLTQEDKRAARILYMPIFEPGWPIQKDPVVGKHGLRDALARAKNKNGEPCLVMEFDYLSMPASELQAALLKVIHEFQPDILLTQIQSAAPLTTHVLAAIRQHTRAAVINWNGDYWAGGLTSREMMDILRNVDLQLIVQADVLPYYEQMGVNAAYWQIGYEEPGDDLPNMPSFPIVFLAGLRSEKRIQLAHLIEQYGGHVFTPGDEYATLYNFAKGKAIYKNTKLIISDNEFPDGKGFVSNRLFQALAAGGGLVLQQRVLELEKRTGITAGVHLDEWLDIADLEAKFNYWLDPAHEDERAKIAAQAAAFMAQSHSFDARVAELFEFIKSRLGTGKQMVETITLKYIGKPNGGGGWVGIPSGQHYEFQPGHSLVVLKEDAENMLQHTETWQLAEEA